MTNFYRYSRRIIYTLALLWSGLLFAFVAYTQPTVSSALSSLTRYYALTALLLLFVSLTPGLIKAHFPGFKANPVLIHTRRAFGVSTFYFALLHSLIGFFHNLNGTIFFFNFLILPHTIAIICSTIAFLILAAMALTSFDVMVRVLGKRWKWLHRLVYLAALLILVHANLIGSHFASISTTLPKVINNLAFLFIFLEAGATLQRLGRTTDLVPKWQRYLVYIFLVIAVGTVGYLSHRSTTSNAGHTHSRE